MVEQLSLCVPDGIEAVSFDVFDTLIVRSFVKPIDLFLLLESDYVAAYGPAYKGFARERENAELCARDSAYQRSGTGEVALDDIYAVLNCKYPAIRPAAEIELELACCFPRKALVDFYQSCRQQGKKTFILSDMYLPRSVIEAMLRKCGVTEWDLFLLSGEEKQSKGTGGLYDILKKQAAGSFGLTPPQILHVGDKPDTDVDHARQAGLAARHVPTMAETGNSLWKQCNRPSPEPPLEGRIWLSICRAFTHIYTTTESPTLTERLGFEGTGPLAAAFAIFVHGIAENLGIKNIYFLARDGLVVKRVFDILYMEEIEAGKFQSHYFLGSRRCFYVASLQNPLSEKNLDHLCRFYTSVPLRTCLESVGLVATDEKVACKAREHFSSLDAVVSQADIPRFRELLSSLSEEIHEATHEQQKAFREYVTKLGMDHGLLVDLGWFGTLQDSLQQLMDDMGVRSRLFGAYFGICNRCPPSVRLAAQGFVVCFQQDELFSPFATPLETLFAAPEGSVLGLRRTRHGFEPIRAPIDDYSIQAATAFQAGAIRFAGMLKPILQSKHLPSGLEYAKALIARLLRNPRREEAEVIGLFPHSADYAHIHTRTVANIEEVGTAGPVVAYWNSWWRDGLLAMMSDEDRGKIKLANERTTRAGGIIEHLIQLAHKTTPACFLRCIKRILPRSLTDLMRRLTVATKEFMIDSR